MAQDEAKRLYAEYLWRKLDLIAEFEQWYKPPTSPPAPDYLDWDYQPSGIGDKTNAELGE